MDDELNRVYQQRDEMAESLLIAVRRAERAEGERDECRRALEGLLIDTDAGAYVGSRNRSRAAARAALAQPSQED